MDLFLSGEVEEKVFDSFIEHMRKADEKLKFLIEKDYGTECDNIAIITMILKPWIDGELMYKERRLIQRKSKGADMRIIIDFEQFMSASDDDRYLLYCKNIVDSFKVVRDRCKRDFRGQELIDDVMKALEVTEELLENI